MIRGLAFCVHSRTRYISLYVKLVVCFYCHGANIKKKNLKNLWKRYPTHSKTRPACRDSRYPPYKVYLTLNILLCYLHQILRSKQRTVLALSTLLSQIPSVVLNSYGFPTNQTPSWELKIFTIAWLQLSSCALRGFPNTGSVRRWAGERVCECGYQVTFTTIYHYFTLS